MLEQFRDIMIIISTFAVIGAALLFAITTVLIFRKVSPTMDAARDFFVDLKSVSSLVTGRVMKPVTKGAIFAAGVRKAVSTLSKRSHRKEKDDDKRK